MSSLTSPTTLAFCLSSAHFLIALHFRLGLSHSIVVHFLWRQCDHTIDNLDTHLFRCPCRSECTSIHNTFQDIVTLLLWKVKPMFRGRSPNFFLATFDDEWIFLLSKMASVLWWTFLLLTRTNIMQQALTTTHAMTIVV